MFPLISPYIARILDELRMPMWQTSIAPSTDLTPRLTRHKPIHMGDVGTSIEINGVTIRVEVPGAKTVIRRMNGFDLQEIAIVAEDMKSQ